MTAVPVGPGAGPVARAQVQQAAQVLLMALGVAPGSDVTDGTFAAVAGVRDGLLSVVRELDEQLALYTELSHAGHDPADAKRSSDCRLCAALAGEGVPTVVLVGAWLR